MGIWQLGVRGKIPFNDRFYPEKHTFDQVFCEVKVPTRWLSFAYVWLGVWTLNNKFLQVGLFHQPPYGTIAGSNEPSIDVAAYSSDSMYYYLQPCYSHNSMEKILLRADEGDCLVFEIGKRDLWIENRSNSDYQIVNFHGLLQNDRLFQLDQLFLILEGYNNPAGIPSTYKERAGETTFFNINVKRPDDHYEPVTGEMLEVYNPVGEEWLPGRLFEQPPSCLNCRVEGGKGEESRVVFKGD